MAAKLKIAGAWSGVLEVELETWSVSMLRAQVAQRSGCGPDSINLICAGKLLKDGDESLSQLGVKNNGKIMATRVAADQGKALMVENQKAMAEEERSSRLARIKFVSLLFDSIFCIFQVLEYLILCNYTCFHVFCTCLDESGAFFFFFFF